MGAKSNPRGYDEPPLLSPLVWKRPSEWRIKFNLDPQNNLSNVRHKILRSGFSKFDYKIYKYVKYEEVELFIN